MSRFTYDHSSGLMVPRRAVERVRCRALFMGASQQMLSSYGGGTGAPTPDPYFSYNVLLVDASSQTNGSTPSGIDVMGKTATWNANAQCKTDDFRFGTSSIYLDGTDDFLYFADSADWAMGTGDASWEAWCKTDNTSSESRILLSQSASYGGFMSVQLWRNGSGNTAEGRVSNGATIYGGSAGTQTGGAWIYQGMCREGGNLYFNNHGSVTTVSSSLTGVTLLDSSGAMTIGAYSAQAGNSLYWKGWVDQVRIKKGIALADIKNGVVPTTIFAHS